MKVATFNINNVNRRLANLLAWLRSARPDVVCIQELKATDDAFPARAIEDAGYGAVWHGQRSWNGVAILARGGEPVLTRRDLPGDPADVQRRYIEAAVRGVLIGCIYLPNGNPQPGPKFAYKLAWFERLIAHAADLHATGLPIVLAGDYNVVPTDADIYPSKSWAKDALLQPETREAFRRLLEQGWTDAIRARHPADTVYTFWDYKRDRWPRDAGLRIDHILLSPALAERLTDAGVDREVRGADGASDHAPAWVILPIVASGKGVRIVSSASRVAVMRTTSAAAAGLLRCPRMVAAGGDDAQAVPQRRLGAFVNVGSGALLTAPSCIYDSSTGTAVRCFAQGTTNGLVSSRFNGTSWGAWTKIANPLIAAQPMCARFGAPGELVPRPGSAGNLRDFRFDGTSWLAGVSIGGAITRRVALATPSGGRLDVFARGLDNSLRHNAYH